MGKYSYSILNWTQKESSLRVRTTLDERYITSYGINWYPINVEVTFKGHFH